MSPERISPAFTNLTLRGVDTNDYVGRAILSVFEQLISRGVTDNPVIPLKVIARRLETISPTIPLRELKLELTEGVPIKIGGSVHIAQYKPEEKLSGGIKKRLERQTGKKTYRRNSVTVEKRVANPNWLASKPAVDELTQRGKVRLWLFNQWQTAQEKTLQENREKGVFSTREKQSARLRKRLAQEELNRRTQVNTDLVTLRNVDALFENLESLNDIPPQGVLSVGYGVGQAVPLRALAYPIAAMEILRERPDTTLEMYIATQFSHLFQTDKSTAQVNCLCLQRGVSSFLQYAYPDVSERASFIPTVSLTDAHRSLLDRFSFIIGKDPRIREFVNTRNGRDSLMYIAAHSLYMRDSLRIDKQLFLTPKRDDRPIVMVGGRGEDIMWYARQLIWQEYGDPRLPAPTQLFTTLGATPPYLPKTNEPLLGEAVSIPFLKTAVPEVYRDYVAILITIAQSLGSTTLTFAQCNARRETRNRFLDLEETQIALLALNELSQSFQYDRSGIIAL